MCDGVAEYAEAPRRKVRLTDIRERERLIKHGDQFFRGR